MSRQVYKLNWAERLNEWPEQIPKPRPRGVKALGRRYENAVALQLGPTAVRGQWWRFRDANGPGLCQTDFIIIGKVWVAILECKHTFTDEGVEQLEQLYLPVVQMAEDKQAIGIQVCKNLSSHCSGKVYNTLESAIIAARAPGPTRLATLHWRGFGPLLAYKQKELAYV